MPDFDQSASIVPEVGCFFDNFGQDFSPYIGFKSDRITRVASGAQFGGHVQLLFSDKIHQHRETGLPSDPRFGNRIPFSDGQIVFKVQRAFADIVQSLLDGDGLFHGFVICFQNVVIFVVHGVFVQALQKIVVCARLFAFVANIVDKALQRGASRLDPVRVGSRRSVAQQEISQPADIALPSRRRRRQVLVTQRIPRRPENALIGFVAAEKVDVEHGTQGRAMSARQLEQLTFHIVDKQAFVIVRQNTGNDDA